MGKQLDICLEKLLFACKERFNQGRRVIITSSGVASCVILLRYLGLLQSIELATLDQLFRFRPPEAIDERILIVTIDETDIQEVKQLPIPDKVIAQLLQKLQAAGPRAIGLHLVRDLPIEPGHQDLLATYKSIPNLVGIEQLSNNPDAMIKPPPILSDRDQVGFSNVVLDSDGKVRRSLLYSRMNGESYESFALKLVKLYLQPEGITVPPPERQAKRFQFGRRILHRFQPDDGAYVGVDAGGFQVLSNFPKLRCQNPSSEKCGFRSVSLTDVLANRVPPTKIHDRIILIGTTARSIQGFGGFFIPYNYSLLGKTSGLGKTETKPISGIELQAYFVSQLLASALSGRPLLQVWNNLLEDLWVFAWACMGAVLTWRGRRSKYSVVSILLAGFVLLGTVYIAFCWGWWIPLISPLLAACTSAMMITGHIARQQEELKRSKEFLHQIINTIADPIFVKNEQHQWIVLNDAFCQFIGYAKSQLQDKSEYNFLPKHQADVFRAADELVFQTQQPQEHEEEFTDAAGKTYLIATKRSLHQDAAGNLFLVGVIRDFTKRRTQEEELKRSHDELKIRQYNLRHLAYHDTLTGLPNRQFFSEQVQETLLWSQKNNLCFALLFIDLDGFKQVNDTLGHDNGDRLLMIVANRLNSCLRGSDTVARLGGDEFTIILRAIPKVQIAANVADKIIARICEPIILDGKTTHVGASIGISIYPFDSQDSPTLIKQADIAMYRAKQLGKNRYQFASLDLWSQSHTTEPSTTESGLEQGA